MRLTKVRVQNFRSVEDSTEFEIGDVTCLVGKNESGKTSILQAIERLDPVDSSRKNYERLKDYPRRHWSEYAERHEGQEATVLTTTWQLDDHDISALEEALGKGVCKNKVIQVSKSYGTDLTSWNLSIDEARATSNLAAQAGVAGESSSFKQLAELLAFLKGIDAPLTQPSQFEQKSKKFAICERP